MRCHFRNFKLISPGDTYRLLVLAQHGQNTFPVILGWVIYEGGRVCKCSERVAICKGNAGFDNLSASLVRGYMVQRMREGDKRVAIVHCMRANLSLIINS